MIKKWVAVNYVHWSYLLKNNFNMLKGGHETWNALHGIVKSDNQDPFKVSIKNEILILYKKVLTC